MDIAGRQQIPARGNEMGRARTLRRDGRCKCRQSPSAWMRPRAIIASPEKPLQRSGISAAIPRATCASRRAVTGPWVQMRAPTAEVVTVTGTMDSRSR